MPSVRYFVFLLGVVVAQGVGVNFLSKRTDDYSPVYFWNLDSAHHGDNGNMHALYALLHNVNLTAGPVYGNLTSGAAQFLGDPGSFMQIANINGTLDPNLVFTWSMILQSDYPTSGSGVIMEYSTNSGDGYFRVRQDTKDLVVDAVDTLGQQISVTVKKLFQDYVVPFVCVTFISEYKSPKLVVLYDEYNVLKPGKKKEVKFENGTVLQGDGDVRFGASFDPLLPAFAGKISCLRFHDMFVVKFHDDPSYLLDCNPSSALIDQSERTIDYIEPTTSATQIITTEAPTSTTQVVTTEAPTSTTQVVTTEAPTSTAQIDTTEAPTSTTQVVTTEAPTSTAQIDTTEAPTSSTQVVTTEAPISSTATAAASTSASTEPLSETSVASAPLAPSATSSPSETSAPSTSSSPSATSALPAISASSETTSASVPLATTLPPATSAPPASPVTAPSFADPLLDVRETCIFLTRYPGYVDHSSFSGLVLGQFVVDNLGQCSRSCALRTGCECIAIETQVLDVHVPGYCFLLAGGVSTGTTGSLYVYRLTNF